MYTTLEGDRSFRGLRNAFKIYKYLFIKKKKTNKKAIHFNIYRLQQYEVLGQINSCRPKVTIFFT